MKIDKHRFDFLPKNKWGNLNRKDRSNLQSFRSHYGWYKRTLNDIDELENQLADKKLKVKKRLFTMMKINSDIDHLRNDYNFSWSVSKLKTKNYYNLCISRRGHTAKSGTLGSPKLIEDHLKIYYKRNKNKLDDLKRLGWKKFLRSEVNETIGKNKVRNRIIDMITKDPTLKSTTINRNSLFPI